ncbi:amidohydrolase family protein [Streptomyces sp. T21Q-yed]|uniref:amidohydrolase family protein n=1 Tax=Streptomyces sp. T21Q-yed TaxID=3018441 RepID=UPI0023DF46EA|nr:amidohydrolase family protein [Streptomyces sp. T21Q-yed]MDF3144125.1 amidohydrolase family protein [Streptomyces sp. T21Q-yed]
MSDTAELVDSHHHVWNLGHRPQPWLEDPGHEPIRRTFDTAGLRSAATRPIAGPRLDTTVVVQCLTSLPETRELLTLADKDPLVGAVVGWVDLTSLAIGEILDELCAGPGGSYLRAVRHVVQGEQDPEWLQRPVVERGLRTVGERGLGYDVLVRSHQLGQAVRLAERLPELPLVLDHAGKPPIVGGDLADWERQVRQLAGHPQVRCKVSGLVTEAEWEKWTTVDIRPVWNVLLSAFGPQRLMFGSDWPVCTLAGGWNRWAETVEKLLADCSERETRSILAGTATDFYRLSPPETTRERTPPCS